MKNNKLIELLESIERILIIENDKEKVVYEKLKKNNNKAFSYLRWVSLC